MILGPDEFLGDWVLSRTIADQLQGQEGRLTGTARFEEAGARRLAYVEKGRLRLGAGPELVAQRQYYWDFEGEGVDVTFDDERPFHRFTPQGHAAGTDHPCGEDYYTVRYDFSGWPRWEAVWTVKGPRKNYVSHSVYQRAEHNLR